MMHSEKNVGEALFGTIMDILDKTKDNVKARVHQEMLCDRPKLDMRHSRGGKSWRKPRADFVLTRPQRREVLEWFQILMFLDGYAANLRRGVNLASFADSLTQRQISSALCSGGLCTGTVTPRC